MSHSAIIPANPAQYVDRTAPFKQRARRCSGDRHEDGGCKEDQIRVTRANLIP